MHDRFDQMVRIVIEMLRHLLTPGAGPSYAPAAVTSEIEFPERQDETNPFLWVGIPGEA